MMDQSVSLLGKPELRSRFQPLLMICCVIAGFFIRDLVPNKQVQSRDIQEAVVAAISTADAATDKEVSVGPAIPGVGACCKCENTGPKIFFAADGSCQEFCEKGIAENGASNGATTHSIRGDDLQACESIPEGNWFAESWKEDKFVTCCECEPKTQTTRTFLFISLDDACGDCKEAPQRKAKTRVSCNTLELCAQDCVDVLDLAEKQERTKKSGKPVLLHSNQQGKQAQLDFEKHGKLNTRELQDLDSIDVCFTMSHCCMSEKLEEKCNNYWTSKDWHVYKDVVGVDETCEGCTHTDRVTQGNWVKAQIGEQFCEQQERFYARSGVDYALVAAKYLLIKPATDFGAMMLKVIKEGAKAELGSAADVIVPVIQGMVIVMGAAIKEFVMTLEKVAIWTKLVKIPIGNTGNSYIEGKEETHARGHDLATFVLSISKFHTADKKFPIWCRVAYSWRLSFLTALTTPVSGMVSAIIEWRNEITSLRTMFGNFRTWIGEFTKKLPNFQFPGWATDKFSTILPEFRGQIESMIEDMVTDPGIKGAIDKISKEHINQVLNDGKGMADALINSLIDYMFGPITRSLLVKCRDAVVPGSKQTFLQKLKALFSAPEGLDIVADSKTETEVKVGSAETHVDEDEAESTHGYDEEAVASGRPDLFWRGAVHYAKVRNEMYKSNWQHPNIEKLASDAHEYFQKYGDKHSEADPETFYAANPHFLD